MWSFRGPRRMRGGKICVLESWEEIGKSAVLEGSERKCLGDGGGSPDNLASTTCVALLNMKKQAHYSNYEEVVENGELHKIMSYLSSW